MAMAWRDGRLSDAEIHAVGGGLCKVRSQAQIVVSEEGREIAVERPEVGVVLFIAQVGHTYRLTPLESKSFVDS